jgi:hypothetical protein
MGDKEKEKAHLLTASIESKTLVHVVTGVEVGRQFVASLTRAAVASLRVAADVGAAAAAFTALVSVCAVRA